MGGASATTTLLKLPAPTAVLTAGVAPLRTVVQFAPPSVDRITPTPVTPA